MLEKRRSCRGILNTTEKLFIAGTVVILLGALLWYNHLHRPPEFSAEKVFQQAFLEAPNSVTELVGDHDTNYGVDYWIKFKSLTPVHLRDAQEFKVVVAEVGRRWFASKWKDDRSLRDVAANYEYVQRAHNDVGKNTREGLLVDKKQHCYFYRYWSM